MSLLHLTPVILPITPAQRAQKNGHLGGVLWFTGLSGAGKSTLALALEQRLFARGCQVYVLDGDNIRHNLCKDLTFSQDDRHENIRRASAVAALFAEAGFIVISSFITPTERDRATAKANALSYYRSVYINADLNTCEQRDVKGLYKLAREGKIQQFTGISSPYEIPASPDLALDTVNRSIEKCVAQLEAYAEREFIAPAHISSPCKGED